MVVAPVDQWVICFYGFNATPIKLIKKRKKTTQNNQLNRLLWARLSRIKSSTWPCQAMRVVRLFQLAKHEWWELMPN
ncbi:hypothetical protein [Pseudomonas soli]|uniref:hypothetical protein n=1 Tax=Pseudomonas soli TaxID=1306993 RepID=UPI003D053D3C